MTQKWDREHDVVVVGSGAGGVAGAYTAAREGLDVLLVEASDRFGGTTAYSGGGVWFPANPVLKRAGSDDTEEKALAYYRAVVGDRTPRELQETYIHGGPRLVEYLEQDEAFSFMAYPWPDYFGELPDARNDGLRHMMATPLPAADLGEWHDRMRGSLDTERLGAEAPELVIGGRALIGRFLLAIAQYPNAALLGDAPLTELVHEGGRVAGVIVEHEGERVAIRARRGVLLAAGGFERNDDLRREYGVPGASKDSMGTPTNTGSALRAAIAAGASVDLMDQAWWAPGVVQPDGGATFTLGFGAGLFVDGAGHRFVNESAPYDRLGRAVIEHFPEDEPAPRYWMIYDDRAGAVPPVAVSTVALSEQSAYEEAGLWHTADTLAELAGLIGVDATALEESVRRFNELVAAGEDTDFQRGATAYDRYYTEGRLPLTPVTDGPFHAAAIGLSDLGTKGGVRTDATGRALDEADDVIPGLYVTGNTMAAPSGETYPGGGNPIGTSLLFGHLAALDLAAVGASPEAAGTADADEIRERVRSYLDAVAAGDADRITAHYAPDATLEDPVGSPLVRGEAAIREFYSAIGAGDGTVTAELGDVRVAGNEAAFGFTVTVSQGGLTTTISPIDVMTFDSDLRIASMRAFYSATDVVTVPA